MDAESDLYYLQARYYDPSLAQFLTVDPLVELTQSPYAYVAGDPLNQIDPLGLTGSGCGWDPVCYVTAGANEAINLNIDALGFTEQIGGGVANVICSTVGWVAKNPLEAAGIAIGAVSLLTGAGEIAIGLGVIDEAALGGISVETLGTISTVTGVVGSGLDGKECVAGHSTAACIGLALSVPGLISSGVGVAGPAATDLLPEGLISGLKYGGFASGTAGFVWDTINAPGEAH